MMRRKLWMMLVVFMAMVIVSGRLPAPSAAGGISAPVLKWAYGGCTADPYCDTGWYSSPAVADLDGDNQPEVIWGSYDLNVLNGENGTVQWSASSGNRVWPGVAVADLTGNGSLEIIVGRGGDSLTVYNSNGTVAWSANPFGGGEVRTVAVADLEQDGQYEILVGRASGGATRQVNVFQANGTVRDGWPARHDGDDGYGWGMYNENLTVGDINNDGLAEIIAPTDTHYITALDPDGLQLLANATMYAESDHNDNGRITWAEVGVHVDHEADLEGFANCGTQHRPNFANVAPALADVNGDDTLEIIVPGDVYNCALGDPDGDLYYLPWIFNLDRTRWAGDGFNWTVLPTPEPNSGPVSQDYEVLENIAVNTVAADLDNDGFMEILYPSYDGRIHAYWLDKTQHGNWPFDVPGSGLRFASEPIVVDLDRNGQAEVIFTSWPEKHSNLVGQLHILDYLGNPLHQIDLPAPAMGTDWNGGLGAPTIANIDSDPDMELVIGTSHSGAVAYDLPGTAGARVLWGTGRGNFLRNGVAQPSLEPLTVEVNPGSAAVEPGGTAVFTLRLDGTYTGTVTLSADVPAELTASWSMTSTVLPAEVTLTVTDTHTGTVSPGLWYDLPLTVTAGNTASVEVTAGVLVGGEKAFLPVLRR